MNEDTIPNFAADVVLRFDEAAESWLMVGEERTLALDASAFSFAQLIDGRRSVAEITTLVAEKMGTPKPQLLADCLTLFEDLEDRSLIPADW